MTDPDLETILRCQAGDASAFGELVLKYQSLLAAMLHRFATSHADLEDLVQDSFVKAWQGLGTWEPRQPFLHWLKRIAVRTALEACRQRKASPLVSMEQVPDLSADERESTPDAAARALEEAKTLLAHLPPEEQVLLTLVHLQGLSMEEAAGYFGWSRAKAKIKAFRARQTLRKLLNRHGYEP